MDLLIVAREDDALAARLHDAARTAGRDARMVGMLEAGHTFTVRVGLASSVMPACPIFLRPVFPRVLDREGRFHHQEAYASVWTAAQLSDAPVVNRPSDWATPGRYSYISTLTQGRCDTTAAAGTVDHVTVVGGEAWRSTDASVDGVDRETLSIEAARWLDLAFCVCTWAVTEVGAHITRIDAFPTIEQVEPNWCAVSAALLRSLS
jgi:hypothetical protein